MIIGLVGFKQVGKSTAAKYLEEKYNAKRVNMKDQLVAEIKSRFPDLLAEIANDSQHRGFIDDELDLDAAVKELFNVKPPLMRALMQNYGTEVRRGDDKNYWCERWLEAANAVSYDEHPIVVVDDVRFINEADYVRKFHSKIIRLTRPDIKTGGTHASETEQLEIYADYEIACEQGDHQKLYDELDKIIEEIM